MNLRFWFETKNVCLYPFVCCFPFRIHFGVPYVCTKATLCRRFSSITVQYKMSMRHRQLECRYYRYMHGNLIITPALVKSVHLLITLLVCNGNRYPQPTLGLRARCLRTQSGPTIASWFSRKSQKCKKKK